MFGWNFPRQIKKAIFRPIAPPVHHNERTMPTPKQTINTRSISQNDQLLNEMRTMIEASEKNVIQSLQSLKQEIQDLKEEVTTLKQKVFELEKEKEFLSEGRCKQPQETYELVLEELEERRRRESNVVIFGLPEMTQGTLEERQNEELRQVRELTGILDLTDVQIGRSFRLGRTNPDTKRPILIKLNSVEERNRFLKQASLLKNSPNFRSVYVHPDLTRMQQAKRKLLLAEVRSRKEKGEDVYISNDRVVSRISKKNFL